ncbi:hypothetical protein ALP45_02733 [Pseudomonas coronafaciens pv. atropurpurea]|nr:hypothetical protein ALP45_02733 [Pseudomonas coronafaciens pv. atropurpurea]
MRRRKECCNFPLPHTHFLSLNTQHSTLNAQIILEGLVLTFDYHMRTKITPYLLIRNAYSEELINLTTGRMYQ